MTLADTSEPDAPSPDEPPSTPGGFPPVPDLPIDLLLQTDDADPPLAGWLDVMLSRAAHCAGVSRGRLSLVVVADDEMAALHEQWKDVPGTTDVLTFDLAENDAPANEPDGDIVVCLDEARRVAEQRGHSLRHEALLYAVHGLLHLLGEDDLDPDSYERMHRREDDILTQLGIGKVFDAGREPT